MKFVLILVLFFSQSLFAKQAVSKNKKSSVKVVNSTKKENPRKPAQNDLGIKVTPLEDEWPADRLNGSQYQIQSDSDNPKQEVVSPDLRDAALIRTGAMKYVSKWDELDKDMLLLRLKNKPFAEVQRKYLMIPPKVLMRLKKELE